MIFANIMKNNHDSKKYWEKLFYKYRFVIMTDSSFEEKISIRLSKFNVFFLFISFLLFCFVSLFLLFSYTPLNGYLPGKSREEVQKNLIALSVKTDSLQKAINNRDLYLKNISNIINDDVILPVEEKNKEQPIVVNEDVVFKKSTDDSLFRINVESKDNGSLYLKDFAKNDYLVFFTPVNGIISDGFDFKNGHFGVDLVAKERSRINSVLDGTVIISHWTAETGFVIAIQHKNDYLSVYKHNSVLLKNVGDFVLAGEQIAIIGNSGELTPGPHLHFELWQKGVPVNPQNYILF